MNFSLIHQSLRQMRGVIQLSHDAALPDIEGYRAPMDFSLLFHGRWLVANGGVTPETSIPGRSRSSATLTIFSSPTKAGNIFPAMKKIQRRIIATAVRSSRQPTASSSRSTPTRQTAP